MFTGSEQLPKQTNTKYTYITLDFGVTIKNFMCSGVNLKSAIGSCIFGSTLVESLCQLGMCQSGVMHTVMSGEHCNSCQLLEKKICCSDLERNLVN